MLSFEEHEDMGGFMLRNPLIGTLCAGIVIAGILTLGYIGMMWCVLTGTVNIFADADVVPFAFFILTWSVNMILVWYCFHLTKWDAGYFLDRFETHKFEKYQYIIVGVLQLGIVIVAAMLAVNAGNVSLCTVVSFCYKDMDIRLYGGMAVTSLLMFSFYLYTLSKIFMSKYV